MTAHLKHLLIAANIAIALVAAIWIHDGYELRKADRMAKRDEQISANQAKVADAQKTVQAAEQSNASIDAATKAQIASLQAQLAAKPDSATIRAIVEAAVPGVKAVTGVDSAGNPIIGVPDTQVSRDAVNEATTKAQICDVSLSDCQQKQANLNAIIETQKGQIAADEDPKTGTIPLQAKQISDLKKFQVPRWTAMFGVGKAQGSSFQQAQSYQPVLGLDYRLTNRFGIFGIAQNKSAAAGISWHFGATR